MHNQMAANHEQAQDQPQAALLGGLLTDLPAQRGRSADGPHNLHLPLLRRLHPPDPPPAHGHQRQTELPLPDRLMVSTVPSLNEQPRMCGPAWRVARAPKAAASGGFVGLRIESASACHWVQVGR